PDHADILRELEETGHVVAFDMDELAKEVASPRASNMVLLGAASLFIKGLTENEIEDGIREIFGRKGEVMVENNLKAFRAGREKALEITKDNL
ncbi:MAG: 2-oxoacid:acceptor oxidoreductase family protein, partial [Muribaculaceae bacterium]|nr:2-oxoacid:acceptor oxidoreductase family protein [Muribaculaceae bacterium]